jgi:hypothetical protein
MLPVTFQFLSAMLAYAINERMARRLDYVQEEVRVLREALLTARGLLDPVDGFLRHATHLIHDNCADLTPTSYRVLRGGSFDDSPPALLVSSRSSNKPLRLPHAANMGRRLLGGPAKPQLAVDRHEARDSIVEGAVNEHALIRGVIHVREEHVEIVRRGRVKPDRNVPVAHAERRYDRGLVGQAVARIE